MDKNHSFSSHPNSRDSSPTSRDLDTNHNHNPSFEEPHSHSNSNSTNTNNTYKVKFLCSYGGKIQPRPHDNHLSYVGGDTKILAVNRNINFSSIMAKLSSLSNNAHFCFKYQLPGEDLDALISVTNDEDLEHMMVEYDRLCLSSPRPPRMRLILFPLNTPSSATTELKPERQWFVDALNSVQIPHLERSSPPLNPDFLFGLDKVYPAVPTMKPPDPLPTLAVPDLAAKDAECGSEERQAIEERDLPKQIQEELHKLQVGNNEILQRKSDEENGRVHAVDCYHQKNPEIVTPLTTQAHVQVHSAQVHVPGPVPVQASFLPSGGGGYSLAVSATGNEPAPVYLIQTPSGIYQEVRPVTVNASPVGPTYYAVPTIVPAAAEVYNATSHSHSHSLSLSASKIAYSGSQVGVVSEHGYSQAAHLPERSVARPGADARN